MDIATKKISIYTADTFGVCSAFYELSGMVVMHDASGCNSTYTTHDEPRWGKIDSQIFISALTEIDAIEGNDQKIIDDIIQSAEILHPKFIIICLTPIPTMIGFDYEAVSKIIEDKTHIKTFGIPTTGMNDYIYGINMAFDIMFDNFINTDIKKQYTNDINNANSINILGMTPLDFYYEYEDLFIINYFEKNNIKINSNFSVKTNFDTIKNALSADMNIVVSEAGMNIANKFYKKYNMPYKTILPICSELVDITKESIDFIEFKQKINDNYKNIIIKNNRDCLEFIHKDCNDFIDNNKNYIIGESIKSIALQKYLKQKLNIDATVLYRCSEDVLFNILKYAKVVIADGLFKPICNQDAFFINYPHVAFSGRLYDDEKKYLNDIILEVKQNEKKFI